MAKTAALISLLLATSFVSLHFYKESRDYKSDARAAIEAQREAERQHKQLRFIYDLANEFGYAPHLVELVHAQSLRYVNSDDYEWRLIKTPEFMTHIMLSLIYAESRGKFNARGDGGKAIGLTQIWLTTARMYDDDIAVGELIRPDKNIEISYRHFHSLLEKYRGNIALSIYAWNRGPGTVDKLLAWGQPIENGFGERVYLGRGE